MLSEWLGWGAFPEAGRCVILPLDEPVDGADACSTRALRRS